MHSLTYRWCVRAAALQVQEVAGGGGATNGNGNGAVAAMTRLEDGKHNTADARQYECVCVCVCGCMCVCLPADACEGFLEGARGWDRAPWPPSPVQLSLLCFTLTHPNSPPNTRLGRYVTACNPDMPPIPALAHPPQLHEEGE